MTRPDIAIVVVTFNSAGLVADLVASLPTSEAFTWHLVVADNDSMDGTVQEVRAQAPAADVVQMGRNAGYAAGINAAVLAAGRRDAYLVLNPDVRLHAGCVEGLLDALDQPGVGIAVPRLSDGLGQLILSMRREPTVVRVLADLALGAERAGRIGTLGEVVSDPRRYDRSTSTPWAEGSTQLVSHACWEACGPWDESFFLYSEEADFDLRAGDLGYSTRYVPDARATHLEGGSAGSPPLWALLQVNRVRLHRKRNGRVAALAFWSAVVLRELSRACLGRPTSRAALAFLLDPRRLREPAGPWSLEPGHGRSLLHPASR
ncbi:glycosyltransferase family 2 protein [Microlunatus capsulatus]|uniref:GT2 family glycosyltransferase n=1 Tax=Microlunatus capsulatus TaxID=99117 RepID=A0ABS4ZC27_9ACTN|nr:glycosyltransferase family 2 protein [Microlunatus capsulatus]MBP2418564.1 GT2 family glycosyltransferase [Microlunatus capsulatus]